MDPGCKKQRLGPWDACPDLSTAAFELRAATTTSKLEACVGEDGWTEVEGFYTRLNRLQKTFDASSPWYKPIIVTVEGANEGGRSFVEGLVDMYPQSSVRMACTPPASLSAVQGMFNQLGGAAARAFNVVSNYMVVQECKDACMAEHQPLVFIIANFLSSAISCSQEEVSRDELWVWPPGRSCQTPKHDKPWSNTHIGHDRLAQTCDLPKYHDIPKTSANGLRSV